MAKHDYREWITLAVVQHAPVFLNLRQSLEKACELILEAGKHGAKLIAFPETWLPGYPVWLDYAPAAALWDHPPAKALFRLLVENSVSTNEQTIATLSGLAKDSEAHVVIGVHELLGSTLYNTMLFVHRNGREAQVHRKLIPTYSERLVWGRGDGSTLNVSKAKWGNIGGLICWEHWMPLARAAMHAQGETIHVAQWPAVKELHQLVSRHYAFEGQCYVLAAGSVLSRGEILQGFRSLAVHGNAGIELLQDIPGKDDDLILNGGSAVIGPDAEYLAGPVFGEPGIVYAEIDLGRIREGNMLIDTSGHYARPDIFQLTVDNRPQIGVIFRAHSE